MVEFPGNFLGKLKGTVFGNTFGIFVSIFTQIALTPILLSNWSLDVYGKWVLYYTLPSLVAFYGSSLTSFGANQAVMFAMRGSVEQAREVIAKTAISVVCIVLVCLFFLLLLPAVILSSNRILEIDVNLLAMLSCSTLLSVLAYVFEAIYRAQRMMGRCLFVFNLQRMLESIGIAVSSNCSSSLILAVICVLFCRIVFLGFLWMDVVRKARSFLPAIRDIQRDTVKYSWLLKGSTHAIAYSLSSMVRQSFPIPLIASFHSMTVVGQFNAARTLSRLPGFLIIIVNNSLRAELTNYHQPNTFQTFRSLSSKGIFLVSLISVISIAVFLFFGEWIATAWLGADNKISYVLLVCCVVQCCTDGILGAILNPYLATNKHEMVSWLTLTATLMAGCGALLTVQYWGPISTIAWLGLADVALIFFFLKSKSLREALELQT